MLYKTLLTKKLIKERLTYDPISGHLTWKPRILANGEQFLLAGERAGSVDAKGYRRLVFMVNGQKVSVYEHRLVWFLQTGAWPTEQVDHIDGDKGNNAWSNLREATNQQNNWNKDYGEAGVKQLPCGNWRAFIAIAGRDKLLGTFQSKADAIAARKGGEKKYRGEWARD